MLKFKTFHTLDKALENTKGNVQVSTVDNADLKSANFYRSRLKDTKKAVLVTVS